ncbi:MAG: HmuY family protein [Bacteroidales bacterium]|jgi:hypothetical protein|nr:HmuY family protein [Bacteroidales bacterium]
MQKIQKLILLIILSALFTSCFKDDERITPFERGDRITDTIPMTNITPSGSVQAYANQVYYSLNDSTIVSINEKKSFDLAFDATEDGSRIWLNTTNFMLAGKSDKTDLEDVNSAAGLDMIYDPSSGNPDSTAIGDWFEVQEADTVYSKLVYVIDRGYDEAGNLLGKKKIRFDSLVGDTYYFSYSNLNNTNLVQASATKKTGFNKVYFSFEDGGKQLQPEPQKKSYDLLFTQYTTLLFTDVGDPYPYLVTGVLLNPYETTVAFDSTMSFEEIDLAAAMNLSYTRQADRIGYTWKDVRGDVESGIVNYIVKPEFNFIIYNNNGWYFKLRFVGFYNRQGVKGFPVIEFQRL